VAQRGKVRTRAVEAVGSVADGASIVVGGFGDRGIPYALLDALCDSGAKGLTVVSINAGAGRSGVARLISERRVERLVCSFPRTAGSVAFEEAWRERRIALELLPMGTLVARLQAAASGLAAVYSPVGAGTALAEGRETREFDGRAHVLETALRPDLALLRADRGDEYGNLGYRGTDRNLNPIAARAARRAVAQVDHLTPEPLAPETVETPGVYVERLVSFASEFAS
jgi:3-oxoadipate CoA-transferase, alpha subunit